MKQSNVLPCYSFWSDSIGAVAGRTGAAAFWFEWCSGLRRSSVNSVDDSRWNTRDRGETRWCELLFDFNCSVVILCESGGVRMVMNDGGGTVVMW